MTDYVFSGYRWFAIKVTLHGRSALMIAPHRLYEKMLPKHKIEHFKNNKCFGTQLPMLLGGASDVTCLIGGNWESWVMRSQKNMSITMKKYILVGSGALSSPVMQWWPTINSPVPPWNSSSGIPRSMIFFQFLTIFFPRGCNAVIYFFVEGLLQRILLPRLILSCFQVSRYFRKQVYIPPR